MGNSTSKREESENRIHPETPISSKRGSVTSLISSGSKSSLSSQSLILTEESKEYVPASCPVCFEHYDYVSHVKVPLECKHFVCQSCYNTIADLETVGCPLCTKGLNSKKISKKPKNTRKVAPLVAPDFKAQKIIRYKLRYLLVGEDHVGITSLLNRLCNQTYVPDHYKTDCISTRKLKLTEGINHVYVKFREAPVGERLSYLLNEDPSKYAGVILCLDLTNRNSFESLAKWHSEIHKSKWRKVKTILVGTKSDLIFKRVASCEDVVSWADSKGYEYYETSAKTGLNIDDTFYTLIQKTVHLARKFKENNVYSLKRTKKNWWKRV